MNLASLIAGQPVRSSSTLTIRCPYDGRVAGTVVAAGREHVEALANVLSVVAKNVRAAIDKSAQLGDADTADLFTGYSRTLDKYLWFLEAHLQADK